MKNNEIIAKYLGYIYTAEIWDDHSDIGGIYTKFKVYSKVPIWLDEDELSQNFIDEFRSKYFLIEIGGWSSGLPTELEYHKDWNKLIEVAKKLELRDMPTDIKIAYDLIIFKINKCTHTFLTIK